MIREIHAGTNGNEQPPDPAEVKRIRIRLKRLNHQVDELSILTARAEQRLGRAFTRFRNLRRQQTAKVRAMIVLEKALGLKRRR